MGKTLSYEQCFPHCDSSKILIPNAILQPIDYQRLTILIFH